MNLNLIKLQHRFRCFRQVIFPPRVGVIGGYHGGNLGDIALGHAVYNALKERHVPSGLQTIYNLERWPNAPKGILGGGAIGYVDSLMKVAERYQGKFDDLALLGVDFGNEHYSEKTLDLLKESKWISCRGVEQAERIESITHRKVFTHPDLAFSLFEDFCNNVRELPKKRKLLINVLPIYGEFKGGNLSPSIMYRNERPFLYENFECLHRSYKMYVRSIVKEAAALGYEVESIPFTPTDDIFAKSMLAGLPVKYLAYHANPSKMLSYMATAEWILPTRFHATIFAMKIGARISPVAYALKNESLLRHLNVSTNNYITADDLARGDCQPRSAIRVNSDIIIRHEVNSREAIHECINCLV